MNKNKKQIISDIINEMINILIIDYKENDANSKDKKIVDYKYTNHQTINATIKKCSGLCLKDYDYDILRDETYAVIYEMMLKISDEYTEDELVLIYNDIHTKKLDITNRFLTGCYKLAIFNVKSNLSGHRRNKKTIVPAFQNVEYTEENLTNLLEVNDEDPTTDIIFFVEWFTQNKHKFLTDKQLQFLDNPDITKTNKAIYRKRIYDNTLKAYNETFNNCENDRLNEINSAIKNIEKLLDNPNFESVIINSMNKKHYIMDAIITHVDLPTMQKFNQGDRSYDVIKAYRVALFKKLAELNQLLSTSSMK